jgi:hypothetical protein
LAALFAGAAALAGALPEDLAGAAAAGGEESAAKAECRQAVNMNATMSKSCFICGF